MDRRAPDRFLPVPPDLAVAVVSPAGRPRDIAATTELRRRAGGASARWVRSAAKTATVYRDWQLDAELGEGDELGGGDALPGFRLAGAEIFAEACGRVPPVTRRIIRDGSIPGGARVRLLRGA